MITALAEAGITTADGRRWSWAAGATACAALGRAARPGRGRGHGRGPEPGHRRTGCWPSAGRLGINVRLVPLRRGACGACLAPADLHRPGRSGRRLRRPDPGRDLGPAAVLDVIYHPWPTRLAEAAAAAGAAVSGGFELLLHQAARQVELMTGQDAPTAPCARPAGPRWPAGRAA